MEKSELLKAALDALERLLDMFKVERYVYLGLTAISFTLLLYAAYLLITSGTADKTTLISIFGSSGLIVASSARISYFFNKAFNIVEGLIKKMSK
jgi:hypothetical protein